MNTFMKETVLCCTYTLPQYVHQDELRYSVETGNPCPHSLNLSCQGLCPVCTAGGWSSRSGVLPAAWQRKGAWNITRRPGSFHSEVTCSIPAHISFDKTSHVPTPNLKRVRPCSPPCTLRENWLHVVERTIWILFLQGRRYGQWKQIQQQGNLSDGGERERR